MNYKQPKSYKFRKTQKKLSHIRTNNSKCCNLIYGEYGIKIMKGQFITAAQLETFRLTSLWVMRKVKLTTALIRFRIFPYRSITRKPEQMRMGGGKADIHHWSAPVKPNTVICEFVGIDEVTAQKLYKQFNARISGPIELIRQEPKNINTSKEKVIEQI